MRGHRISECLCFHQQGCSFDWWGDWGWGVCYKSAALLWGWLAARSSEFSQGCLTSVVKGQLWNVFILTTQSAWLAGITSYHLHPHAHSGTCATLTSSVITSSLPDLYQVMHLKHMDAHLCSPKTLVLLLPIKIWRVKTVRLSFLQRHRRRLGNIQTALPQAMKSNRSSLQS